jgi:hypothetical protein
VFMSMSYNTAVLLGKWRKNIKLVAVINLFFILLFRFSINLIFFNWKLNCSESRKRFHYIWWWFWNKKSIPQRIFYKTDVMWFGDILVGNSPGNRIFHILYHERRLANLPFLTLFNKPMHFDYVFNIRGYFTPRALAD